jgi:hypothetical protein
MEIGQLLLDNGARQTMTALKVSDFEMRLGLLGWADGKLLDIIGSEMEARRFRAPFYACVGNA